MKKALPATILALLLTGCGGADQPAAEPVPAQETATEATTTEAPEDATEEATTVPPEPELLSPGTYTFETGTGTTGTMEVPGEPVPEIEELRGIAAAEEVAYITATIDNRQGEEAFDFYEVSIYDPAGEEYIYSPAGQYVFEILPEDMPTEQYNQYIDLSNSFTEIIDPLQLADSVLVGPPVPNEITGVVVTNGIESFEATPAE